MLKGTILKNLFKVCGARCASYETAEKLLRKSLPMVYQDNGVFISHIEGLGDIELYIYKEAFIPHGKSGLCYCINVKSIYTDDEDGV